jgi:hypothetical protein
MASLLWRLCNASKNVDIAEREIYSGKPDLELSGPFSLFVLPGNHLFDDSGRPASTAGGFHPYGFNDSLRKQVMSLNLRLRNSFRFRFPFHCVSPRVQKFVRFHYCTLETWRQSQT